MSNILSWDLLKKAILVKIEWDSARPDGVGVGLKQPKSQNCVKAVIAFVCTTCKRQLLFALLQLITFVCTTAIENILNKTPIVSFVCLTAIANILKEQQLLYGLLQPLQLTSHYYSCWHLNAQWWLIATTHIN